MNEQSVSNTQRVAWISILIQARPKGSFDAILGASCWEVVAWCITPDHGTFTFGFNTQADTHEILASNTSHRDTAKQTR